MATELYQEKKANEWLKDGCEVLCHGCLWGGGKDELITAKYSGPIDKEYHRTKKVCPSCGTWILEDVVHTVAFLKARRLHKKLPECQEEF